MGRIPHQHGAAYREIGSTSWWDDVVQHSGMELSYLNLYDAVGGMGARVRLGSGAHRGDHQARQPVWSRHRGQPCRRRTNRRTNATNVPRSVGSSPFNQPIDMATAERMIAAAQADVVIAPGYADGVVDALRGKRKNTRLLEAPAHRPRRSTFARSTVGSWCRIRTTSHRLVDDWQVVTKVAPTDDQWRDAELAWLGMWSREVEQHRAGEGRCGVGYRRRPTEPCGVGRDRGQEGRRPRRGVGPVPATRSIRSPTASRPPPWPGVAVVIQPGDRSTTSRTSKRPTSSALPWCSPANATSCTEHRAIAGSAPSGSAEDLDGDSSRGAVVRCRSRSRRPRDRGPAPFRRRDVRLDRHVHQRVALANQAPELPSRLDVVQKPFVRPYDSLIADVRIGLERQPTALVLACSVGDILLGGVHGGRVQP